MADGLVPTVRSGAAGPAAVGGIVTLPGPAVQTGAVVQAPRRSAATGPGAGPNGPAALTGIPGALAGLGALAGMTAEPTGPAGTTVVPNGLAGTTAAAPRAQDHDLVARRAPGPTAAELHRSRTM